MLTAKGEQLGRLMYQRHKRLEEFLRLLGVSEETIQRDVEGIEHHVSPSTMNALSNLVLFFDQHAECLQEYQEFCKELNELKGMDPQE